MRNQITDTTETAAAGTLARGLDILEWVAGGGGSMAELTAALGLSRSAAYRITGQLRDRGYLADGPDGRLLVGPVLIRLGLAGLDGLDVHTVARPHLHELVEATAETAFIAVLDEDRMVYIMQEIGPQVVTVLSKLGSRAPLHASGLGKAYLAALAPGESARILDSLELTAYTPTTLTSRRALDDELARIRETGWALDDAEHEPGVRCIAAAVLGPRGTSVAAVSVAGPRERILANEPRIIAAVRRTATAISTALGAPLSAEPSRPPHTGTAPIVP